MTVQTMRQVIDGPTSLQPLFSDPRLAVQDDCIVCLICGARFRQLTNTHLRSHGTNVNEYRARFGYNRRRALMCRALLRLYMERAVRAGLADRILHRPIVESPELRRLGAASDLPRGTAHAARGTAAGLGGAPGAKGAAAEARAPRWPGSGASRGRAWPDDQGTTPGDRGRALAAGIRIRLGPRDSGTEGVMKSAAPGVTRDRSMWSGLRGRVIWCSLTVAVMAGAAVMVWALPHAHRAADGRAERAAVESSPDSSERIASIDEAVQRGDFAAARAMWRDVFQSLRPTQDWQAMAALGDSALRIAGASGTRGPWEADARRAYLGAMFRARTDESLDGVLRAAEAFATLGDRDVAEEGLRVAESVASRAGTAEARDRVRAYRARLEGRDATFRTDGPARPISWDSGP